MYHPDFYSITGTEVTVPRLSDESTYTFGLYAFNDAGQSPTVETSCTTTDAPPSNSGSILPTIFPGSSGERPPTDTGYQQCSSSNIEAIGISYNQIDGYDTIHFDPSTTGAWTALATNIYSEMISCLTNELNYQLNVSSWVSINQQFDCHILGHPTGQTGPTWDLEGHREPKDNWLTTIGEHWCNW